jgi:hypothetical protein
MAILELFTSNQLPKYLYTATLDGTVFQLEYAWNQRMDNGNGKWTVSLSDSQGNLLIGPVPVIATWPLFTRFKFDGLPAGTIFPFDSSGQNLDPGRFDLGDRVRMLYLEAGT